MRFVLRAGFLLNVSECIVQRLFYKMFLILFSVGVVPERPVLHVSRILILMYKSADVLGIIMCCNRVSDFCFINSSLLAVKDLACSLITPPSPGC